MYKLITVSYLPDIFKYFVFVWIAVECFRDADHTVNKKSLYVFFSDKCIVQVISPATVNKKLWINDEGKFYQAIPIYVRGNR